MREEYKKGLDQRRENRDSDLAKKNVLEFYEENEKNCKVAYKCYKRYCENIGEYVTEPTEVDEKEFRKIIGDRAILLITANPIERAILIYGFAKVMGTRIPYYLVDSQGYHVIDYNQIAIVHIHAQRTGDEFARRAINAATRFFSPKAIFLLGVCYGIDFSKYKLGTVFIADDVKGFRVNFRDKENTDDVEYEAEIEFEEMPNGKLIGKVISFFDSYQPSNTMLESEVGVGIKVHVGKILSRVPDRKHLRGKRDWRANQRGQG